MVTDEQYEIMEKRIVNLERRVSMLGQQLSVAFMREDATRIADNQTIAIPRKRDVTKYSFKGELCSKRGVVLNVIKQIIKDKGLYNSTELLDYFPDYIQGSLGVVKKVDEAERYARAKDRFFFLDKDVLHLKDGDYVVCKQWDSTNIKRFLKIAEREGYSIVAIKRDF